MQDVSVLNQEHSDIEVSSLLKSVNVPDYQRIFDKESLERIDFMVNDQKKRHDSGRAILFPDHIHIAKVFGNDAVDIIDGQHRLASMRRLHEYGLSFSVPYTLWELESPQDVRKLMQVINSKKAHMAYELNCEQNIRRSFDTLRRYMEANYQKIISSSKSPMRPNINMDIFIEQLINEDTLKRHNLDDPTHLIAFVEAHNQRLKKIWQTSNDLKCKTMVNKCNNVGCYIGMDRDMSFLCMEIDLDMSLVKDCCTIKKSIPKSLRISVWNKYIGENLRVGECNVCKSTIRIESFECGHIIARKNGGDATLSNLVPICGLCNKSMATTNLNTFKEKHYGV
jgi:5-methylcytosine-specific restriction endonuclease McrA